MDGNGGMEAYSICFDCTAERGLLNQMSGALNGF
jgi:hypothetical protein